MDMVQQARQRNSRGQGALLRDEILSAATRVIDDAQTEGEVSLRSIARAAGIAAPSVYSHFDDRDDVLDAVAESSWAQVCDEITAHSSTGDTPRNRLVLGCQAYVSFAQRYPMRYALMTQSAGIPAAARQALEIVTRALLACRAEQGPQGAASGKIAAAFSVALHGVAMLHRSDTPTLWLSDFSTDEIISSLVDSAILQQDQTSSAAHGCAGARPKST